MDNSKTFLITGGTGYIGGYLTKYLLRKYDNCKIYLLVRSSSNIPKEFYNDKIHIVEYNGESSLIEPIKNSNYCIHLAALYTKGVNEEEIDQLIDSNIKLSSHIFNVADKYNNNISIVTASTFSSLDENAELMPQTFYAATKSSVEIIAKYYKGLSIKFLTFPDTYGPNDSRPKIHNILNKNQNWPFTFNSSSKQEMYMMNVEDLVNHIMIALDNNDKGVTIYDTFLSGDLITLGELAEYLGVKDKCIFNESNPVVKLPKISKNKTIKYTNKHNVKNVNLCQPKGLATSH